MAPYRCVCCGHESSEIYKKYSPTVLRLTECENCHKTVDKYIEYDPLIVMIDLVLQKPEAYRRILFNSQFQGYWKLEIVFLVCEAITQWKLLSPRTELVELELSFYLIFLYCFLVQVVFFAGIWLLTTALAHLWPPKISVTAGQLFKGLSVAQFGKLFLLLGIVWNEGGSSPSSTNLVFVTIFVFISNVQMISVLFGRGRLLAFVAVTIAFLLQTVVSHWIF